MVNCFCFVNSFVLESLSLMINLNFSLKDLYCTQFNLSGKNIYKTKKLCLFLTKRKSLQNIVDELICKIYQLLFTVYSFCLAQQATTT